MRILFSLACTLLLASFSFAAPVDFARDVRPILSTQCFQCHGPDEKARKAKLRLDVRDEAVKAGALVPGKPDESELYKRICSTDPDERMPPEKLKKPPSPPRKSRRSSSGSARGRSTPTTGRSPS